MGAFGVIAHPENRKLEPVERTEVLDQLARMLAHPLFRHSKRYPALLRYVVEHTVDGATEHMKERTLGIEVFGRSANYDTNQDPVVRATAGEIRKRIAQYYYLPENQGQLRIELPLGTYVPEFHLPVLNVSAPSPTGIVVVSPATAPVPASTVVAEAPTRPSRTAWMLPSAITAAVMAVLVLGVAAWRPWNAPSALDRFWSPLIEAPGDVLMCVGQPHFGPSNRAPVTGDSHDAMYFTPTATPASTTLRELYGLGRHHVALTDAVTLARVAGVLESHGKKFNVRGLTATSFEDLRGGPVVLVGAFNNEWTLRLTSTMRFRFQSSEGHSWITDSQKPGAPRWEVDSTKPYLTITDDYAMIARVRDPTTGRFVVVAAGLSGWGTQAAGELLAENRLMETLARDAPPDWASKNIQAIINTKVVAGNSGPPMVVAKYFW